MSILKSSDFVGRYAIAQDMYSKEAIAQYISDNETDYLIDLLGSELTVLFLADLDPNNEPQTQIYKDIFDEFTHEGCGEERSKGIKFYLKTRLYFDYVRDYATQLGINSMGQNENTNSKTVGYNMFWLVSRVNEGMATGKAIQLYIEDNSDDYPTFSANELNYVIPV